MTTTTIGARAAGAQPANRLQPTAPIQRSPQVRAVLADLAQRCKNGGASSMMFLPARDVPAQAWAFAYHTGKAKEMNLKAAPADGMVKGTIVINPSGHDSTPGALERFAKTNTYNVRVQLPNGETLTWNNVPRNDPSKAEYATAIDVAFPYMKGVTVVEAWPGGSAGVGGYLEGRRYHVHSADQPFDIEKARADARAADRASPPTDNRPSTRPYDDF